MILGNAAITWTPSTDDASLERVYQMQVPMRSIRPGFSQPTFVEHSLDRTAIDTITVGSGAHELEGAVRYADDPQSLMDLVVAGAQGTTVTYIPNLKDPDVNYACKLVAPVSLAQIAMELDSQRGVHGDAQVTLRLRQTDQTRFQSLYQGTNVLFHYRAGGSLVDATWTGDDDGYYSTANGTLTDANTKARVHYHDLDGDGFNETPTLLLEDTRENLIDESEDISTWSVSLTPVRTGSQADPKGGTAAYIVTDNDGADPEYFYNAPTFTGDGVKAVSLFIRQGSATNNTVILRDVTPTAASRLDVDIAWATDGSPSNVAANEGTLLAILPYTGGWYRMLFSTTSVTAVNSHQLRIYAAGDVGTDTGSAYFFGFQVEDAEEPGSYIPTTGAADTRTGDVLSFPFTARPQAMTLYERHIALGYYSPGGGEFAALIGSATDRLGLVLGTDEIWDALVTAGGSGRATGLGAMTAPSYGDVVEILATLGTDGVVNISQSVNGGALVSGTASSAGPLPTAWDVSILYLGLSATTTAVRGVQDVLVMRGVQSMDTMRRAAGV